MYRDGELIGQNMFMRAVVAADDGRSIPIMTMGPICIKNEWKRKNSISSFHIKKKRNCRDRFFNLLDKEKELSINTEDMFMNITVYLGALEGNDPALKKAVEELGTWIGTSGNALVYGGSKTGLMGAVADSVLRAGGKVTGVEPQFFIDSEFQHDGLTELIVTKDMAERKTKMIELGDAFIAFPGGTGTLEEIAEIMSKVSLKQLDAPCILYNLNGYYDSLKELLQHMIRMGLSTKERQEGIYFAGDLSQIQEILGYI